MEQTRKDIIGYEGLYKISDNGIIVGLKYKKPIFQYINNSGYYSVTLHKNGVRSRKTVHRLLARSFIGESELVVNHLDGNKLNNILGNLEFCTISDNLKHAHRLGYKNNFQTNYKYKGVYGKDHFKSKIIIQKTLNNEIIKERYGGRDVQRSLGFNNSDILKCCKGKRKTCGGYIWEFKCEQ